jgi:hypothetical protein
MALDAVFAFLGIMKMSIFRHVVIISGTGIGGGSWST